METFSMIVGVVLVIAYIVCAIALICECSTTSGTVCTAIAAIGIGALVAQFIECLVAIAIGGIVLAILGAILD